MISSVSKINPNSQGNAKKESLQESKRHKKPCNDQNSAQITPDIFLVLSGARERTVQGETENQGFNQKHRNIKWN